MSGKFMSIKRYIIPTITMVIIASQLLGCAAASQNELLDMLQHGEAIEIEVAVPLNQEDGTAEAISWEQLALLETNETLRKEWDNILGITITETGKNGMLYVNAEGNNENNNTLRVALHNRAFSTLLTDDNSRLELSNAAQGQYADLEADETDKALYMAINGYFNLLPDATPNFSNPDSTLNRLEFMSMVMRAETPVQDITPSTAFSDAVGSNDLNIYAQEVAEDSYLDLGSKSLNNMTANGTITRGEAVYFLMSRYFSDELASVDISKATLKDVKDGGNIAEKMSAEATSKDYWKSYELSYVLQFPDQGAPTDLYKALVLAEQKGIITSETRFDEGITKAESIELLITTLMQEKGIPEFNYKQAKIDDHEVEIETPAEETEVEADNSGQDGETVPEVDGTDPEPEPDTDGDPFDDNYIDQLVKEILAEQQPSGGSSSTAGSSTPEADAWLKENGHGTYDPATSGENIDNFGKGGPMPEHLHGDHIQ